MAQLILTPIASEKAKEGQRSTVTAADLDQAIDIIRQRS